MTPLNFKQYILASIFLFLILPDLHLLGNNTIEFFTQGQQYGVADLDYFEIADSPNGVSIQYEAEDPDGSSVGMLIYRENASDLQVWGQLGTLDIPQVYPPQMGSVWYTDNFGFGTKYIRMRYSKHSNPIVPIQIFVDGVLQIEWTPENQNSWENFAVSEWFPITFDCPQYPPFFHPFQNYDDDVDRIKTFSNAFTGNFGTIGDTSLILKDYSTSVTRTGKGRSLELTYNPLNTNFVMYAESFERKWFDFDTYLDFTDLFPDYADPAFKNRNIDSIVFYCKLDAIDPLKLKLELHDKNEDVSAQIIDIENSGNWERISVALNQFEGVNGAEFNPEFAKYMGFVFAGIVEGNIENLGNSGVLYIDDIYLVENNYEKPTFTNDDDFLNYINKINFRHFWTAVEPVSKFALDRHIWEDLISVDAIGFQLSAYVIGHKHGWVDPDTIEARVEHILTYLLDSCEHTLDTMEAQTNPLKYASVKGNWAHFLDHHTLARKDLGTEFSLFSNALLLAGVITAGEYFNWNSTIVDKAHDLYCMTDWNFLYQPEDGLMTFHWTPEDGFSIYDTDWFSEELDLAFLLGISSPKLAHRLPENPFFNEGYKRPLCSSNSGDYVYSAPGSNFTYSFLQMYAKYENNTQRFQNTANALLQDLGVDQNSLGNFEFEYDPRIFGISACEGPDSAGYILNVPGDTLFISNYHAYGYCCKFDENNDPNGTLPVYGSASAILFLPDPAIEALKYYYNELDSIFWDDCAYAFWSPIFGYPDAFHLDPDNSDDTLINGLNFNGPWLSVPRFGIDIGPMMMNIDSYLSELPNSGNGVSIREWFSGNEYISPNLIDFESIPINEGAPLGITVIDTLTNATICEGEQITVVAFAENFGMSDLNYEWTVNNQMIANDSASLTLYDLSSDIEISCQLIATDHCGDIKIANSNILTVTVHSLPVLLTQGDFLDCNNPVGQVMVDSDPPGATYEWTGPDSFSSTEQNPGVDSAGIYTVTVTLPNGCSSQATAIVDADFQEPNLLTQGDTLDCNNPVGHVMVDSDPPGAAYEWTGPDSFTSTEQNPGVDSAGIYTVTVTLPNGCSSQATAIVDADFQEPVLQAQGDFLDCNNPLGQVMVDSDPPGAAYEWTGPDSFSSTEQNPGVDSAGIYTVTVTLPNGCSSQATAIVDADFQEPVLQAQGDFLDCNNPLGQVMVDSDPPGATYEWTGPDSFSSTEQNPVVDVEGEYAVTVTLPNGCSSQATAIVDADFQEPNLLIQGDTLDCNNPLGQVMVDSDPPGAAYEWTGPDSFSSTEQNPGVDSAGIYTVTVTLPNGCSSQATAIVDADFQEPVLQTQGDFLDCNNPLGQVMVDSDPPGATYEWTGPDSFSSTEQNPGVDSAGIYTVTVTLPNGCSSQATAIVDADFQEPVLQAQGDFLDCNNPLGQVMVDSDPPGATYEWTGPDSFSSTEQNPSVDTLGTYTVTVTLPNGCSSQATAIVDADFQEPSLLTQGDFLDCNNPVGQVMVDSDPPGATYEWTGPNSFSSTEQNPGVDSAGIYTVTVTLPNGCSSQATAIVDADFQEPVLQTQGDFLDCNNPLGQVMVDSDPPGATYEWTGPDSFSSTEQNPSVDTLGTYTVTVTLPNGCSSQATAIVDADFQEPNLLTQGDTLDCNNPLGQVMVDSDPPGATYEWTGPDSFSSTEQNPGVDSAGIYTVTVTLPNGCSSQATAIVDADFQEPSLLTQGDFLDCNNPVGQVMVDSDPPGATYEWTGPDSFSSTEQNPGVDSAGIYTVTVTLPNGCSSQATAIVDADFQEPSLLTQGDFLDCNNPVGQVMVDSDPPGATYEWTGPDSFSSTEQNPGVDSAGIYTVTVTLPNGCSSQATAIVDADFQEPGLLTQGGTFDCNSPEVQLMVTADPPGVNYFWTGPNSFSSTEQNPFVDVVGTYMVMVTAQNGCTNQDSTVVDSIPLFEPVFLVGNGLCGDSMAMIGACEIIGETEPYEYFWNTGDTTCNIQNLSAGTYSVTITDVLGCTVILSDSLTNIDAISIIDTTVVNQICPEENSGSIDITVSGGTTPYSFLWSNADTTEDLSNLEPGQYEVTIEDANNCNSVFSITVDSSIFFAVFDTIINNNGTWNISAFPTGGLAPYDYLWCNGQDSSQVINLEAGMCSLTITDNNGCEIIYLFDIPTSTKEIASLEAFEIYPNPTQNELNIHVLFSSYEKPEMTLINIEGKILFQEYPEGMTINKSIDTSKLPSGSYLFIMRIKDQYLIEKVVKVE